MIQKLRSSQKGFTLIELMIVIAIIGILAAIAVPQFLSYRMRSYNTAAKAVVNNVKADQGNLNAEFGVYGHTTGAAENLGGDGSAGVATEYSATAGATASAAVPGTPGAVVATTRADGLSGSVGIALGVNMNCIAYDINDANNNSSHTVYARHVKGDTAYGVDSDIENQIYFLNNPDAYVNKMVLTAPTAGPASAIVPANDVANAGYSLVP